MKSTGDDATRTANMDAPTLNPGVAVNRRENPEGQAIISASMNENADSFAVSGSRSTISVVTSVRCRYERPRFPCSRSPTQSWYCEDEGLVQTIRLSDIGRVLLADALPADHDARGVARDEANHEEDD